MEGIRCSTPATAMSVKWPERRHLGLRPWREGKLIVVGVPGDPIQLNAFPPVFGGRSIQGSLSGTPIDGEGGLVFCVLENIRPMIETVPLEQAVDSSARGKEGKNENTSKPDRKRISEIQATSTQAETGDVSVGNSARDDAIRRRAYEIYRERGEQPGRELDDWLQAERELKRGMLLNPECGSATADIDTLRLLNCHDLGDC